MRFLLVPLLFLLCSCQSHSLRKPFKAITYNVHYWSPEFPKGQEAAGRKAFVRDRLKHQGAIKLFAAELKKYDADVIALQEVPHPDQARDIARALDMNHVYFPGGEKFGSWKHGIAGAILTRHRIIEHENCPLVNYITRPKDIFSRYFGRVLIEVEGRPIAVYGTHLLSSWKNTGHIRIKEFNEINAVAQKDLRAGKSVLIMGDFNLNPDSKEYRVIEKSLFKDTFALKGRGPAHTCPAAGPVERIDYILAAGPLLKSLHSCRALYEHKFVVDEQRPQPYALSDHIPVMAVFK